MLKEAGWRGRRRQDPDKSYVRMMTVTMMTITMWTALLMVMIMVMSGLERLAQTRSCFENGGMNMMMMIMMVMVAMGHEENGFVPFTSPQLVLAEG